MKNSNQRFWAKVNKTDTCWLWTASKNWGGYGSFRVNKKKVTAHRYSYEIYKGKIPNGLQLDHLCRNRACVNPEHHEPVTNRENVVRGKIVTDKKSGLPVGVRKTAHNKYQTQKKFNGVKVHLGNYITPTEASVVYQTAVLGDSL